jgi:hypothetical protein
VHPVYDAFEPLLGLPSWQVVRVHGSIIKMDFGAPTLVVDEPRLRALRIDGAPDRSMRRSAHVRGDWTLTITYCEWSLLLDEALLAHSESSHSTITRALNVLNGQALSSIRVHRSAQATTFGFDLGCVLQVRPASAGSYGDEPVELWTLAQPNDVFLALRSDEQYSQDIGSATPDDSVWTPLSS